MQEGFSFLLLVCSAQQAPIVCGTQWGHFQYSSAMQVTLASSSCNAWWPASSKGQQLPLASSLQGGLWRSDSSERIPSTLQGGFPADSTSATPQGLLYLPVSHSHALPTRSGSQSQGWVLGGSVVNVLSQPQWEQLLLVAAIPLFFRAVFTSYWLANCLCQTNSRLWLKINDKDLLKDLRFANQKHNQAIPGVFQRRPKS